jgi:glutaredoxin
VSRVVTLYTARDCHLCDRARDDLAPLATELELEVEEVDITGVMELEQRFREWIPVVALGGEQVSVYRVDARALRQAATR